MTLHGQLAQSARSAKLQTVPQFADLLVSMGNVNSGLLGNAYAQTMRISPLDVDSAIETYRMILSGSQPSFKLAMLKRQRFTSEGRHARIETSLAALNAPQPTELTLAQWKALLEEIEDED